MGKLVPRLDNVFGQALEIADANERAAFVERAGGGDETLRQEVESLLQADQGAGDFMKAMQVVGPANLIPSEQAGDRIGRYKLMEQNGQGGSDASSSSTLVSHRRRDQVPNERPTLTEVSRTNPATE